MTQEEAVSQFLGICLGSCLAALAGRFVSVDARKRGAPPQIAVMWGVLVFLAFIVFMPLYLFLRSRNMESGIETKAQPLAAAACPYCQYPNKAGANFCEKCNRLLRSSNEIHSK